LIEVVWGVLLDGLVGFGGAELEGELGPERPPCGVEPRGGGLGWELPGGEGVALVGPFGDQAPEGSVGGEDAVVAVAVEVGWGEDRGQPVQELESREREGGTAGGVGVGEEVEDLVGSVAYKMEPLECEGGPGVTNASRRCPRIRS
jgi:hypothetical protein